MWINLVHPSMPMIDYQHTSQLLPCAGTAGSLLGLGRSWLQPVLSYSSASLVPNLTIVKNLRVCLTNVLLVDWCRVIWLYWLQQHFFRQLVRHFWDYYPSHQSFSLSSQGQLWGPIMYLDTKFSKMDSPQAELPRFNMFSTWMLWECWCALISGHSITFREVLIVGGQICMFITSI